MQKFLSCVVLALVAGGCAKGENPAGPGGNGAATPLVVLDGRTGTSVPAVIAPAPFGMELTVPGFLTLRPVRQGGDVFLWPNDSALPVSYTRALVYRDLDPGQSARWADGVRVIGLRPLGVFQSGRPLQTLQEAAMLASAAHPVLEFVVGNGDRSIPVEVTANDPTFTEFPNAGGFARMLWDNNHRFIEGRIVIKSISDNPDWEDGWVYLRIALAHEMIHASGLIGHVPVGSPGIMGTTSALYSHRDFTDNEKLVMGLQYRRVPGTRLTGATEDETVVSAQSVGGRSITIVD